MVAGELEKSFDAALAEEKWYRYWQEGGFFHALDESSRPPFAIVIPPPNVTGMLHMGHALNNALQDIVIRYKRMKGFNCLWMPGTDHAGIATQNVVENLLAREGQNRRDLGRDAFIARVWEWKEKFGGVIINQLKRLGCSCDWERERFTMDPGLSRAVREVFVRLYNDGLIYRGDYVVQWCPRCHTAISDLEVEHTEREGFLWHLHYPFVDGEGGVLVATTRPETMLGDTAVAVNPEDVRYQEMTGRKVRLPLVDRELTIVADSYVSADFGSGAVKITPACDPNDFAMAQRHNLPLVAIMDGNGVINENGGAYQGQDRYLCRENILKDLQEQGYLIRKEPYVHSVGRCYRCKTDIEPTVSTQWFVRVAPLAREALAAVREEKTRIIPSSWENTYYDWMENIRDWCISRQIWWGHRIPVWYCDQCGRIIVSSADPDSCPDCLSVKLRQEEDVLDTWFSSALWPFSTLGWPDQTRALKTFYPTSLLVTGFDILFFWVARMMMMGLYVMKDVPFRDVYLHALVRDEQGEKMSKSRGNIIDPLEMVDKYGADAFRFTLAAYTAQGRDVKMSPDRIEGYKHFVNKIWNAAKFVIANSSVPADETRENSLSLSLPDRWIRHEMNRAIATLSRQIEEYRFNEAAASIYQFVWREFCDWYLELVKPILYGKLAGANQEATRANLREALSVILRLLHPFMPFVTEEIWQTLEPGKGSIMVCPYPEEVAEMVDEEAERQITALKEAVVLIRNIRAEMEISPAVRLKAKYILADADQKEMIEAVLPYIEQLANLESLGLAVGEETPPKALSGVTRLGRLFVIWENTTEVSRLLARREKELGKIDRELAQSTTKLANQDFLMRAEAQVIEKERGKNRELTQKRALAAESLEKLRLLNN